MPTRTCRQKKQINIIAKVNQNVALFGLTDRRSCSALVACAALTLTKLN